MPLKVLVFVSDACSGEVLRDSLVVRFLLTVELAEIIASGRWEIDPSFPDVPSRLLSSHSWKQVTAFFFFEDDILRLEARALVKAAGRSAHSQPVHDCRMLLLSDHLSIVLCFYRGRSRDFRLLTQIRLFASLCLARNIWISIRWIPSEFNSSDRDSREHDSAYDATKSLVDPLGSNDVQTFPASHAWLSRELGSR